MGSSKNVNVIKSDTLKKIYLVSPRGFCAGVSRAIKILNFVLENFGPPIYVRHQIVHNRTVVADFEKRGVVFSENIQDVPDSSRVVFSAHGTPPQIYKDAKMKKLTIFDAACPLVAKVHFEAKRYAKEGYLILYIGHKHHQEPIGVLGEVPPTSSMLISSLEEAKSIKPTQTEKLVALSQTTLSFDDTNKIIALLKQRFPKIILPPSFDICYSTQNRQNAVKELAKKAKLILVIGSKESSNANRLREVAQIEGATAYLIDNRQDIKSKWLKNVKYIGITAGASTPDYVIESVVKFLKTGNNAVVEEIETVKENIKFPFDLKLIQK
jgi:4-hydroxy-3-methylbut-2-en-1-yl diphosphate reductase